MGRASASQGMSKPLQHCNTQTERQASRLEADSPREAFTSVVIGQ